MLVIVGRRCHSLRHRREQLDLPQGVQPQRVAAERRPRLVGARLALAVPKGVARERHSAIGAELDRWRLLVAAVELL